MTLSYIVSEIQTDGQAKCIYRYIYIYMRMKVLRSDALSVATTLAQI